MIVQAFANLSLSLSLSIYLQGVLYSSRLGSACATVTQRDATFRVRDLREDLRARSEPGSAQSCPLSGNHAAAQGLAARSTWPLCTGTRPLVAFSSSSSRPEQPDPNYVMSRGEHFAGEELQLQNLRQELQALLHALHTSAHPFRHTALSVPVLREEVPPEVGHEEAHLHPHR